MLVLVGMLLTANANADYVVVTPPKDVRYSELVDALKQGNLDYASYLAKQVLYGELKQALYDEKDLRVLVKRLQSLVERITNDNSRSESEKVDELIALINASFEKFSSKAQGELGIVLKHAPEFGVTRIEWDRKIEVDECKGFYFKCKIENGKSSCWTVYFVDYVTKVPDYYIYRVVDGQDKHLATLRGTQSISRSSTKLETSWSTVWDLYKTATEDFELDNSKAFWFDYDSDMRTLDTRVEYKVVADNSPYQDGNCGTSERYQSVATLDGDGDGYADFIPTSVYAKYFGKYYGWLIPSVMLVSE
jgi:hypothetical protein